MYVYASCAWFLGSLEEGIESPGNGVMADFEPSWGC